MRDAASVTQVVGRPRGVAAACVDLAWLLVAGTDRAHPRSHIQSTRYPAYCFAAATFRACISLWLSWRASFSADANFRRHSQHANSGGVEVGVRAAVGAA